MNQKEFAELVNLSVSNACKDAPHHGEEFFVILPAPQNGEYSDSGIDLEMVTIRRLKETVLKDKDGTVIFNLDTMGSDLALFKITGLIR